MIQSASNLRHMLEQGLLCVQAVSTIHQARIVHSDLKPANFLVVEGQLKLIDFGIAKAINGDTTSIARDAQVGYAPHPHTCMHAPVQRPAWVANGSMPSNMALTLQETDILPEQAHC